MSSVGEKVLLEQRIKPEPSASGHSGLSKLVRVANDIRSFINDGKEPSIPFAGLATTIELQQTLNAIHQAAARGPVLYKSGRLFRLGVSAQSTASPARPS
ncbi:MAG: hypothetical protein P8Y58_03580 [Novosphingobium sp.]